MRYILKIWILAVLALLSGAHAITLSGLHWNVSNGTANSNVWLKWTSPPPRWPLTILYKYKPHQQTGYYATFWYTADNDAFSGASYYQGGLPYPPAGAGGTAHRWEVAHDGTDTYTTQEVVKGVWYPQGFVSELDGSSNIDYTYYWAIDSGVTSTWIQTAEGSAANLSSCSCTATTWSGGTYDLSLGVSPWTANAGGDPTANDETLYGVIRDLQIFDTVLSASEIAQEMATESNAAVTSVGGRHLWYSNMNPTPSDVTDKSGSGNNPSWVNALRPAQWDSTFGSFPGKATLLGVGRP